MSTPIANEPFARSAGSGALTWSERKPKRRGWWWRDEGPNTRAVLFVEVSPGGQAAVFNPRSGEWIAVEAVPGGRWAGPLPEPQEPSPVESRQKTCGSARAPAETSANT